MANWPVQANGTMRAWSDLTEGERLQLLEQFQRVLDDDGPSCDLERKIARMQAWLGERGVRITEADIRPPRPPRSRS